MSDFHKMLMMAIGFGAGVLAMRKLMSPKSRPKGINMDTLGNIVQADEFYKNNQKTESTPGYLHGTEQNNLNSSNNGKFSIT